jgi:hypothetical protein
MDKVSGESVQVTLNDWGSWLLFMVTSTLKLCLLDKTSCMRASRAAQYWLRGTEEYELWGSAN